MAVEKKPGTKGSRKATAPEQNAVCLVELFVYYCLQQMHFLPCSTSPNSNLPLSVSSPKFIKPSIFTLALYNFPINNIFSISVILGRFHT